MRTSRVSWCRKGFSTIEEIAYVPASELNGIEEFDEEIVKELRTAGARCAADSGNRQRGIDGWRQPWSPI